MSRTDSPNMYCCSLDARDGSNNTWPCISSRGHPLNETEIAQCPPCQSGLRTKSIRTFKHLQHKRVHVRKEEKHNRHTQRQAEVTGDENKNQTNKNQTNKNHCQADTSSERRKTTLGSAITGMKSDPQQSSSATRAWLIKHLLGQHGKHNQAYQLCQHWHWIRISR